MKSGHNAKKYKVYSARRRMFLGMIPFRTPSKLVVLPYKEKITLLPFIVKDANFLQCHHLLRGSIQNQPPISHSPFRNFNLILFRNMGKSQLYNSFPLFINDFRLFLRTDSPATHYNSRGTICLFGGTVLHDSNSY